LFEALELKGVLDALFGGIIWHPVKVFLYDFDFWYGQADTHERIEGDRKFVAVWALYCALELPMHEVDYNGLVSLQMILPRIFSIFLIVEAFRFDLRDNGLFLHPIQIFVETVQHEVKQLLGVLLIVIVEVAGETSNCLFELPRG
jgi:hypothetical protein